MPRLFGSVFITVFLLVVLLVGGVKALMPVKAPLPGDAVPVLAAQEVKGTKHGKYSTSPPTSGWYRESNLRDGFHSSSITDEEIVGVLHQGKIAIAYNCRYGVEPFTPSKAAPSGKPEMESDIPTFSGNASDSQQTFQMIQEQNRACAEVIEGLRSLVKKTGQKNVILFPYNKMETRIALLSWGRMEKLLWLDESRVKEFIEAYRGR